MTSYNQSIANLKSRTRANTNFQQQQNTASAATEGQRGISEARDIAGKLSGFSETLGEWKKKDILEKQEQGKIKARQAATENSQKLAELNEELLRTKEEDTRYQEIKAEMLRLGGEDAYPDADRIAGLSPWQQVGYAKEKLRAFNESFPDKLAHSLQNSEKAMTIQGITFTPKELRENNIQGLPFKEAAVNVLTEDIRKASGVDKFSPELLKLAKTEDSIQAAKDGQMAKFRERYNIESSSNTRQKALKEWSGSAKDADDFHRLILINSNTVDQNNKLIGNSGGLDLAFKQLEQEGISGTNTGIADKYGDMELPEQLRKKLGAPKGTTFEKQWPGRFATLRSSIKRGIVKKNNAELKWQKTAGTALEAEFIEKARKADLSTQQVNEYKRRFGKLGLAIPSGVTNYETATMRDEREDKQKIEDIMAANRGYISNEELDRYNPKAALEFRDKATKMEKEALKAHDSEAKIKAHMDTAFTNMGIKANEKSPAYVEAMSNAKADYAVKYNRYVSMGYSSAQASHLALHAQQVTDKETGEVMPDSMGVLTEIKTNGEASKYVVTGQAIEKELKPGHLRVARIKSGKEEIRNDRNIINNGTIGGDYGHRQITTIQENVDKHGYPKGLYINKSARQYYEGLARGRDGNWQGLVDAQLKATGHPGLWPNERPPEQDLFQGKDKDGNLVSDPDGLLPVAKALERAGKYPSLGCYLYSRNEIQDCTNYKKLPYSVWELSENQVSWLRQ